MKYKIVEETSTITYGDGHVREYISYYIMYKKSFWYKWTRVTNDIELYNYDIGLYNFSTYGEAKQTLEHMLKDKVIKDKRKLKTAYEVKY